MVANIAAALWRVPGIPVGDGGYMISTIVLIRDQGASITIGRGYIHDLLRQTTGEIPYYRISLWIVADI